MMIELFNDSRVAYAAVIEESKLKPTREKAAMAVAQYHSNCRFLTVDNGIGAGFNNIRIGFFRIMAEASSK